MQIKQTFGFYRCPQSVQVLHNYSRSCHGTLDRSPGIGETAPPMFPAPAAPYVSLVDSSLSLGLFAPVALSNSGLNPAPSSVSLEVVVGVEVEAVWLLDLVA